MDESKGIGQLAAALAKAQGAMSGAVKDARNPHFNSSYASLAAVWDAARKPLTDNGLAVVQMPEANGNVVIVRTLLIHESGESLESSIEATARDASPQAVGSVVTYLRRYALAAMVGIAPEDDDGNAGQAANPQRQEARPRIPTMADASTRAQHDQIASQWRRVYGEDRAAMQADLLQATGQDTRTGLTRDEARGYLERLRQLPDVSPAAEERQLTTQGV